MYLTLYKLIIKQLILFAILLIFLGCERQSQTESNSFTNHYQEREAAFPPEMEPIIENFNNSRVEYISITAKPSKTKPWESKFLGLPYLPKSMQYPLGKDGKPLQLLAQINFEEVPTIENFPEKEYCSFICLHITLKNMF